jgi:predicted DNA-binding protein (UPF0251 family)
LSEKLMASTPRDAGIEPPSGSPVLGPAFARLTDTEREAMLLVAFEDLDHAEAGRVAGVTPETFAMRVSRARKKLRVALAGALVVPMLVLAASAFSTGSDSHRGRAARLPCRVGSTANCVKSASLD